MNIVYSKEVCPYCDMAKTLLKNKGIEFEEKVVGVNFTREELLEAVPNARSVPQIVLDGKLIGSYEDLKKHFASDNSNKFTI
jgi:glutaredoxin